jgi:hypothetical protein
MSEKNFRNNISKISDRTAYRGFYLKGNQFELEIEKDATENQQARTSNVTARV